LSLVWEQHASALSRKDVDSYKILDKSIDEVKSEIVFAISELR